MFLDTKYINNTFSAVFVPLPLSVTISKRLLVTHTLTHYPIIYLYFDANSMLALSNFLLLLTPGFHFSCIVTLYC